MRGQGDPADQQPEQGVEGRTHQSHPPHAGRDGTSPGQGHRPPDQPGQCATGLRTLAVTQPSRWDAEDARQQREHNAGDPGAYKEMTEASGPQESNGSLPTTASRPMSPQQAPSTGSIPEGHLDTIPEHPSATGTTLDQDREKMPPPPPRPPQRRNTDLSDGEELRAIFIIHANTPPCGVVAALQRHLQDVNRKQALRRGPPAARRIPRHLFAAAPGTRHPWDADRGQPRRRVDLVVQVQTAGPGRRVGPAPGLGAHAHCVTDGAKARAPGAGNAPPHDREPTLSTSHGKMAWRTGKAGQPPTGAATSGTWWSDTHQERRRHSQDPHDAKMTPAPSP